MSMFPPAPRYGPHDATPLARTGDPATSHAAAEYVVSSGVVGRQQDEIHELVQKYPGRTSQELATLGRLGRDALTRRLPELERMGRVVRGAARVCDVTKRYAATWSVAR
jgi:hypothetical protein